MEYYISILIAGFGGGAIRGLIGFIKHQYAYKNVKFELSYFSGMLLISGAIGVLTAITAKNLGVTFFNSEIMPPALALVIGYAGGDFLENMYKIIIKKPYFSKK